MAVQATLQCDTVLICKEWNIDSTPISYANQQKVIRRRKRRLNDGQEQHQQRLEHEAALQRIRRERTFKDQCDSQGVMYCSPKSGNELVYPMETKKNNAQPIYNHLNERATVHCITSSKW